VAYWLIVAAAFAGPFVFGTAVATTLGAGIADYGSLGPGLLLAAVLASLVTVLLAYMARVPTSMSLALVSAMVGSLLPGPGASTIHWPGVLKVAVSAGGSIFIGFAAGAVAFVALRFLLRPVTRALGDRLMHLQYASVALLALGYGANDAEKMAGLMAAAGSLHAGSHAFSVPLWALAASVAAFAVGMAFGGVRIAKTVGGKLFTIRPEHALAFQSAAGCTVVGAALMGGPLSTTETTASAIIGVGTVARPRRVHWPAVRRILAAWLITIPAGFAIGAVAGFIVRVI